MNKKFLALVAGTSLVLMSMAPVVQGQEGFIIKEEAVGPNVKYMSGGVGLEERKAMETQASKGYDMKLEFAITPGNYVSFVDVKINDQSGKPVINTQSNGPWFYADLPKGTYTVVANYDGKERSQKITVNGGLKKVTFHFKSDEPAQASVKGETKAGTAKQSGPAKGDKARPKQPSRSEQGK